jgi:glycosyltransferase involved in cell wall biosynthesis
MRILLTTESYLPYLSGVTVSVDALARGLTERGHDVLVLAPRPARGAVVEPVGSPGPAPRHAWLPSYQLPRVAPPGYRMPWPVPWAAGVRAARAFRPQMVHAHSPFVTGLLARGIARSSGAPLVFTHHTRFADYRHYAGWLAGPVAAVTDAYLGSFWGGCAAVVAPSSDLAAEIRERRPDARIVVIPTGIDVDAIRGLTVGDARSAAGWDAGAVVVATLGRLAREKSPRELLEAVALAANDVPDLRLLVVGGGPEEPALRDRAARPDLAGRVWLTGQLPRPQALAAVAGADLFAFASRTETQGLVLAEALASGLPVVAVEGPGVQDSVRDGVDGLVVAAEPSGTRIRRLAGAIAALAMDAGRRAMMAARARDDADRFSVGRRVAETEELYRSVVP